jgi:hypothetical protein
MSTQDITTSRARSKYSQNSILVGFFSATAHRQIECTVPACQRYYWRTATATATTTQRDKEMKKMRRSTKEMVFDGIGADARQGKTDSWGREWGKEGAMCRYMPILRDFSFVRVPSRVFQSTSVLT